MSIPGALLPSTKYNPGNLSLWYDRKQVYKNREAEIVSELGWLGGEPMMISNSPEVAKQMLGYKTVWDKPDLISATLAVFGPNVFSTNKADWPRHRRIVQPGFSPNLYHAVWSETINTYYDCLATEKWEKEREFIMPNVMAITSKFALYLIAKCGFGIDLSWNESIGEKVNGMTMTECFEVTSGSSVILSMLPRWMFYLPLKSVRRLSKAKKALEMILQGIIDKRRAQGIAGTDDDTRRDIFSHLLKANAAEKDSKASLTDRELVSNVFLLLLAGHETTSRALAATLGLLASHPEEQQRACEEVMGVLRNRGDPTFDDFERLPYVQGCFNEGLRMFPSSNAMIRAPLEDTTLSVPTTDGRSTITVPVKAGQYMWADWIGVGYNERIYPSPYEFKPERWLDPTTEPLLNFSYGPRVCIGKKFALAESVGLLSLLLRDYKIEPVLKPGETLAEWQEVWEKHVESNIGFGPQPFPLKFTRRAL